MLYCAATSSRFSHLPSAIYKLDKLEILLVSDNQLQDIDAAALRGLKRLSTLDLQNNSIVHVPPELGLCEQLRCVLVCVDFMHLASAPLLEYTLHCWWYGA